MDVVNTPPVSTYRLQIHSGFTFDDAAAIVPYLRDLGVTHAYLSPILQAAPGSAHGYDVVDHGALSADAGGEPAFRRLAAALREHGLSAVADLVPNHMAVPEPESLNRALWTVLRDGPTSSHAAWFDVDWEAGPLLMPVLGQPIGDVVAAGELKVEATDGAEPVLRYYDHVFPLREGTAGLPLPDLLDRQFYRLAWWRVGAEELNYRRFFDVTTLAGIRVEDPAVFDPTHRLIVELIEAGSLTGLRIDHPDGLADPRGYLRRLEAATGGTWVVVEKILESDEQLPTDWPCAGTTGYDALNRIGGLFLDPASRERLDALGAELAPSPPGGLDAVILAAKEQVVDTVLVAEVNRLVRLLRAVCRADLALRDHSENALRAGLRALLIAMDRYRAYGVPGEPFPAESAAVVEAAAERARATLSDEPDLRALAAVTALVQDTTSGDPRRDELVVRFQQTCGPVMAKGIEDTTFYRWHRLIALNEVGADPHAYGYSPAEFHAFAARLARDWPATMTTLSTHDTKRSEDARARLIALAEVPDRWAAALADWMSRFPADLPSGVAYLFWQTVVAAWVSPGPPDPDRIVDYLRKAGREGKQWTNWITPDAEAEARVEAFARSVLTDPDTVRAVDEFVVLLETGDRAVVLGQKLLQLTMPGVPDVYQGCEVVDRSLVDPDNRRPVDYTVRAGLLASLESAPADTLDTQKLLVTSRTVRLRREHPDWFAGGYAPIATSTPHLVAFGRGAGDEVSCVTLVTRLPEQLGREGGWKDSSVDLPAGDWVDLFTGARVTASAAGARVADVLTALPVALLIRD
jgi:(1->4)-alpha-D-glucan 1-alpha-D-glucosylmutase